MKNYRITVTLVQVHHSDGQDLRQPAVDRGDSNQMPWTLVSSEAVVLTDTTGDRTVHMIEVVAVWSRVAS